MPISKLLSLPDAIARFIPDGSSVAMGTALEPFIPFAAGHELVRQGRRDLTLIGPISDMLFDQLVGAGCVKAIRAAWIGNVMSGSGYNIRRAVESGQVKVEDHSNLTLALGLLAGAMGVTYLPTRTALGSDLYRTNPRLRQVACPFTGDPLTAVEAIRPDAAVVHVQRCDEHGNAQMWGNLGVTREAMLASRHVIVITEQIVPPDVITSDPNRTLVPGFRVDAVCHVPWGAHPSGVPGFYNRDHAFAQAYGETSRTAGGFAAWRSEWIDTVPDRAAYLAKLGPERQAALAPKRQALSVPADYGY